MAVQDNHPGVGRKAKFRGKRKWDMKWISKPSGSLIAGLLLLVVLLSPGTAYTEPATDPVLEWNAIIRTTVATDNPLLQTRSGAMMHLAVFEAVNTIVGDYKPYLETIEAPAGASPEAAAIAAAHRTLVSLHPTSKESLNGARDDSLSAIPDGPAKNDGITVGEAAADAILALRTNDGAANASDPPYTPGAEPGDWQPTPPGFAQALSPNWGKVTTFGIKNGAQFRSNPPPAIHTAKYARDYNEVKAVGDVNSTVRPQRKTDLALYFGINPPVQVFGQSASQASAAQGKTLSENARIFALLHMAMADGLISSMESKFYYEYWRPVTAIRAGDTDGNKKTEPDADWLSLIDTPSHPSYPSNYASAALAARAVLEEVYGKGDHSITLTSISPLVDVTLHYTTFSQMTDDIDDARVYGGVHYRFDQEAGSRMGWGVGSYILRNYLQHLND
jgi:hypothetical protein